MFKRAALFVLEGAALEKGMPLCYLTAACWAGLLLDRQVVGDDQRLVGIGEGGLVTHPCIDGRHVIKLYTVFSVVRPKKCIL
jgi:hypothetical protein